MDNLFLFVSFIAVWAFFFSLYLRDAWQKDVRREIDESGFAWCYDAVIDADFELEGRNPEVSEITISNTKCVVRYKKIVTPVSRIELELVAIRIKLKKEPFIKFSREDGSLTMRISFSKNRLLREDLLTIHSYDSKLQYYHLVTGRSRTPLIAETTRMAEMLHVIRVAIEEHGSKN